MKNESNVRINAPFRSSIMPVVPEILNPDDFKLYEGKEVATNNLPSGKNTKIEKECICKIIDTNTGKISIEKEGMFIFLTDSTRSKSQTLIDYSEYIFDRSIVSLIIDKTHLKLLFGNLELDNNHDTIYLEIYEYQGFVTYLMYSIMLIILTTAITRICYKIVKSMSNKDPMYEDFVVSSANIKKFREVNDKSMSNCLICFEEYTPEDDVRILDCEHFFHPDCVDRWLIGHSRCCPYCRKEIIVNEIV